MRLNIKRIRNKDHDIMMSYLEADDAPTHASYAWWYHSNRAAKYIRKLEKIIDEKNLSSSKIELPKKEECCKENCGHPDCKIIKIRNQAITDCQKAIERK